MGSSFMHFLSRAVKRRKRVIGILLEGGAMGNKASEATNEVLIASATPVRKRKFNVRRNTTPEPPRRLRKGLLPSLGGRF